MKRILWLAFCVLVMMMSWEGQLTSANVMDNGPIPQESIRLRIIANSDSFQDQWLKREVRDALIAQMNVWADDIRSYDEAKQVVAANLPALQQVVDKTVRDRGFSYNAVVDFGQVEFPTKLYGSYVYPAGNYEALRVRIGEAKGQNWWCVLFPPLCFIDMSNGDAVQAAPARPVEPEGEERDAVSQEPEKDNDKEKIVSERGESVDALAASAREDWREWRLFRMDEQEERFGPTTDVSATNAMVSTEADAQEAATAKPLAASEEAPPAPEVQVRFYILEKLEKLFS